MLRKVTGRQILSPLEFSVILYCESPVYLNSERLRFFPPVNSSCSLPYRCPCMSWHCLLGWIPTGSSKYSQLSKLLPADLSGFAGGERKSRNGEEIIVCDQKTQPPHQLMKWATGQPRTRGDLHFMCLSSPLQLRWVILYQHRIIKCLKSIIVNKPCWQNSGLLENWFWGKNK